MEFLELSTKDITMNHASLAKQKLRAREGNWEIGKHLFYNYILEESWETDQSKHPALKDAENGAIKCVVKENN